MTVVAALDARTVRAMRTVAQGIGGRAPSGGAGAEGVAGVARRMLALQGQDAPGVRWSVGLRAPGTTDADVAAALMDARVVRTWPMRGTLHLVHPADVRWLLGLTADRMLASMAARRSALGITPDDCTRAVDVAHAVLAGRRGLGRSAFLAALDAAGVSTAGQRGYHLLAWAAISGHVILGGGPDAQPVVLLADEWLPATPPRDRDEALTELAVRYVAGHGPASEADLARWTGLPVTQVRRGIAAAGDALETVTVDGRVHHVAAGAVQALTASEGEMDASGATGAEAASHGPRHGPAALVHLLPGFDEYLLGYADRSSALAPEHVDRVIPGANGMFRATVIADGRVVGTWTRSVRAREVGIRVEPFPGARVPDGDQLAAAVAAYGAFAGRPATVTVEGPPRRAGARSASR